MLATMTITGAAPTWVVDKVNGPTTLAPVVHAGSDAVYFQSEGDVIGIVSARAVASPCTITTLYDSIDDVFTTRPRNGDEVMIGEGMITIGHVSLHIGRFVDFSMPQLTNLDTVRERLIAVVGEIPQSDELDASLLNALRDHPTNALLDVLGRGSGLTPFGDDVVSGMLATLLAADHSCAQKLSDAVIELAPRRTTSLSATLLKRATHGEVLSQFAALVSALLHRPDEVVSEISRLRSIGHTSGAGMLLGLHLGLDHIRSCPS